MRKEIAWRASYWQPKIHLRRQFSISMKHILSSGRRSSFPGNDTRGFSGFPMIDRHQKSPANAQTLTTNDPITTKCCNGGIHRRATSLQNFPREKKQILVPRSKGICQSRKVWKIRLK